MYFQKPLELTSVILIALMDDLGVLFSHFIIGLVIGITLVTVLYFIIRSKKWFKRTTGSFLAKWSYRLLRASFYLSILGFVISCSLYMGSLSVVEKETKLIVEESLNYCKNHYFKDYSTLQELFSLTNEIYKKGEKINQTNHRAAEIMVDEISKKYGLGFLGPILLKKEHNEMITLLESAEKGIITMIVTLGLEKIGAVELLEEEDIDKAFYAWIHSETDEGLGNMSNFFNHQILKHVKPLVFGLWLPMFILSSIFLILNIAETLWHFNKKKNSLAVNE